MLLFSDCNSTICNELQPSLEKKITTVTNKYGDVVRLEVIPCESRYINIYKKKEINNDSLFFNRIHEILYDNTKHEGWTTLIIFDSNKNYIYSHSSKNNFYRQLGD